MEAEYAVEVGAWKITQNADTYLVSIFKYGHEKKSWDGEKRYTHDELYEMLVSNIYDMRGEK